MAFYGKLYKMEKQENFADYVDAIGLPAPIAEAYKNAEHIQKIEKNGDGYTYTIGSASKPKVFNFKNGEEFESKVSDDITLKMTFTIEGNNVTEVLKSRENNITTVRKEFSGDSMKETITCNFWNGTAYKYYKA